MNFYHDLADWWPLFSAPEDYEEEASLYFQTISKYRSNITTALELGSGGGNNAFYLKKHFDMTLTDLSEGMIEVSKSLNPECKHFVGDMREISLGRTFDLVFVHDAIMFMTTEDDLARVFRVAYNHLEPGGVLFIAPDFFKETFKPSTSEGGHDGDGRSLRYLEWIFDSDPDDNLVEGVYVFILRDENRALRVEHEDILEGLFSMDTWKKLLEKEGFEVHFERIDHSELEPGSYYGIVAVRQ